MDHNQIDSNHLKDVFRGEHLRQLWRTRKLADLILKTKQEDFYVHSTVMALASKYLWQRLTNENPPPSEIKVMVDHKVLRMFLEYIYEGRLNVTEENVEKLHQANLILDIAGVTEQCNDFMMLHIDDGNWDRRFHFARTQKCSDLIDLVISYVNQNYMRYLKTPQFLEMRKEDVIALLNIPERLNHREEEIFDCVLKWLKFKEDERARDAPDMLKELDLVALPAYFLKFKLKTERVLNSVGCSALFNEALRQQQYQEFKPTLHHSHLVVPPPPASESLSLASTSTVVLEARTNTSPVKSPLPSTTPSTVVVPPLIPASATTLSSKESTSPPADTQEPPEKRSRQDELGTVTPLVIKAVARKSTGGVKKQQFVVGKSQKGSSAASVGSASSNQATELAKSTEKMKEVPEKLAEPSNNTAIPAGTSEEEKVDLKPPKNGPKVLYFRTYNGEVFVMSTDLRGTKPKQLRQFIGASNPTLVWTPTAPPGKRRLYALGGFTTYEKENSSSVETRYITENVLFKANNKDKYWYRGKEMKQERTNFQAVVIDDTIYVFGGAEGPCGNEAVNCAEKTNFTHKNPRWEEIDYLQRARHSFGAGVIDGKIYVCGGYGSQDGTEESNMGILNTVECYDPAKDEWKFVASMMKERWGPAVVVLDNKLYAIGGGGINYHTDPEADVETMKSAEVYDPREDSWTQITSLNRPRKSASAVVISGKIYVIGGDASSGTESELQSSVEVYDPARDKWTMYLDKIDEYGSFSSVAVVE